MLIGGLIAVLFAAVATSGSVELVEGPPTFMETDDEQTVITVPEATVDDEVGENIGAPYELPHFVEVIARVIFAVVLASVAVLVLIFAWRHRPRLRWRRRRRRSADFEVLDDIAATIAADAEAQRAALRHGAPRNAIVECWLRLETAVVVAGGRRDPADTATEFTQRVLASAQVDRTAIDRLAALYREARFSNHTMEEADRQAAIAALNTVHEGLRVGTATVGTSR